MNKIEADIDEIQYNSAFLRYIDPCRGNHIESNLVALWDKLHKNVDMIKGKYTYINDLVEHLDTTLVDVVGVYQDGCLGDDDNFIGLLFESESIKNFFVLKHI